MRFIKCLILLIVTCFSHSFGQNRIAFDIYKKTAEVSHSNFIFSPISISSAIAQVYIGSEGITKNEISDVFEFEKDLLLFQESHLRLSDELFFNKTSSSLKLSIANSILVDAQLNIYSDYLHNLRKFFKTEVFEFDFKKKDLIVNKANDWVAAKTNKKIENILVKSDITDSTKLLLLNAIYFKDKWKKEFKKKATKDDYFYLLNKNKIKTKMMNCTSAFGYSKNEIYETINLPYKTENLSMLILLPLEIDGLTRMEESNIDFDVEKMLNETQFMNINLSLPSFKFEYVLDNLRESLIELGMKRAFDFWKAEFGKIIPINKDVNMYLDKIKHKAFVEINEEGTEAIAATALTMGIVTTSVKPQPKIVKVDHPFMFIIVDKNTNSILFIGRVLNPKA